KIGFRPIWQPDDHVSFFTAAEGWGLFRQQRDGHRMTYEIELRYGRLRVTELVFRLPDGVRAKKVHSKVAGRVGFKDGDLHFLLTEPVTLSESETLAVEVQTAEG
ncbi:MAG: glucosylceramidase, partial [Planctomycetes bacterium]|nr:glucosylceramidase [Planctomycetota bacterium]